MPFPNEHSCRLKSPAQFTRFGRKRRVAANGKTYSVILGSKAGQSSQDQAYRYPKDSWTAGQARAHCVAHGGRSFEAAVAVQELEIPFAVSKEPGFIQRAYVHEFNQVLEATGSAMAGCDAANKLVLAYRKKKSTPKEHTCLIMAEATLQELAVEKVPAAVMERVKKTDPHPFFAIFRIGREGYSSGTANNQGMKKYWSFASLKELVARIKASSGDIIGGNHTQSAEERLARPKLGKIVHAFTKKLREGFLALGILHITDDQTKEKIKSGFYDVCSVDVEALLTKERANSSWFVRTVTQFNNLVLGNRKEAEPGFASAGLVATVQELSKKGDDDVGDEKDLSIADVKVAIEKFGWTPDRLFGKEVILQSRPVMDAVEETKSELQTSTAKEVKKLTDQIADLSVLKNRLAIDDGVKNSKLLADKGDKLVKYVRGRLDIDLLTTKDAQVEVDNSISVILKEVVDLGMTFKEDQGQANDEDEDGEDEGNVESPGSNKQSGSGQPDMTDPKHNPLIVVGS